MHTTPPDPRRPIDPAINSPGREGLTGTAPADVARLGIVRSFQISAVFPHLTVLENVRIALQRKRGTSFDFWRSTRALDTFNARAMELIRSSRLRRCRTHAAKSRNG